MATSYFWMGLALHWPHWTEAVSFLDSELFKLGNLDMSMTGVVVPGPQASIWSLGLSHCEKLALEDEFACSSNRLIVFNRNRQH